jgi:hypothetical protein
VLQGAKTCTTSTYFYFNGISQYKSCVPLFAAKVPENEEEAAHEGVLTREDSRAPGAKQTSLAPSQCRAWRSAAPRSKYVRNFAGVPTMKLVETQVVKSQDLKARSVSLLQKGE